MSSLPRTSAGTSHAGHHGLRAGEDLEEQVRGAAAGVGQIDVRVSVINGEAVRVLQHAVGEDTVEVLRDHDGEVGTGSVANLLQQVAFWV